ncbi:MAG: pilus assembly protein [Actinobacteria bacterium]|nr:pilus assembly protein [Actinomycetota bacterium]
MKSERASTIVETIFWLPVWVIILMLMLQGGAVLYAKIIVSQAAREGARAGAVSLSPVSDAKYAIIDYGGNRLPGWKDLSKLSISVETPNGALPGNEISVSVRYGVPVIFSALWRSSNLNPPSFLNIEGNSSMIIEFKE